MKIAFTSCSNIRMQQDNQPIWGIIEGQNPDVLLLLGDNVYMGTDSFDADALEANYKRQRAEPHFSKLLCNIPYLAVWDNHDFGVHADQYSDDLTPQKKQKSRALFDKYLKRKSLRPDSDHVYCSYTKDNVRIIMLDVRSHQLDPTDHPTTLLGNAQEEWLREQMLSSTGITIICSGITYSGGNPGWQGYTNWDNEFRNVLRRTSKPLFLGGSAHTNDFKIHDLNGGKLFYEAISSSVGRNHERGDNEEEDTLSDLYAGLPHNKYGMINITGSEVEIVLYSQKPSRFFYRIIDANTWRLKKENSWIDYP